MSHSNPAGALPPAPSTGRAVMTSRSGAAPLVIASASRSATSQFDAIALMRALARRWKLAFSSGILCAIIAAGIAWVVVPPSQYTVRALLHVASETPHIIFQTAEQRADFTTYQRTQLTLIKSRLVLNSALNDDEVQDLVSVQKQIDQIAWLEGKINASYFGEVLTISMSGSQPGDLKILVNAVANAYLKEIVSVEANDRRKRYDDLREIYSTYQSKLQEKRAVLNKLAEQVGSTDKETIRLTHEFAIERRAQMQSELLGIRVKLREAEVELAVKAQNGSMRSVPLLRKESERETDAKIEEDKYLQDLVAEAEQLTTQQQRLQHLARRPLNDPVGQRYAKDLAKNRDLQEVRRTQLREWYAGHVQQTDVARDSSTGVLRERVQVLKLLEKVTDAEVKSLSVESQSINKNSLELETLQDEIQHQEVASDRVGDEVEALSIELHAPARVRIAELADAPRLEADKRPMMAGMAGFGALGMVIFGIALLEYQARRIGTIDEVVHGLGLRLMGSLPDLPAERPRRWIRGRNQDYYEGLLVESVDATRAMLLHSLEIDSIQVVMVTSALAGEGKTSLACHLATSLARAGRSTLLLDGDLRKPAVHHVFGLEGTPGFAELLRGEATIDAAIQAAPDGGPWIISAGACDSRAIQALSRRELDEGFQRLRERFEFIIVDTSPVLPVSDALHIGRHVDVALCSILQGFSRAPKVLAANERLSSLGIRVLGAVVAGARNDVYSAAYHYPVPDQV